MVRLYFEAEKRGYAVAGTTNLTEFLTGFYIKWGDDSTDIEPIMHLYKSQVYKLASEIDVPQKIIDKKPSPDIAPGITDEYALGMSYENIDRILEKLRAGGNTSTETAEDLEHVREYNGSGGIQKREEPETCSLNNGRLELIPPVYFNLHTPAP